MIMRENSRKPEMQYWEHESKSHQCNHYNCEGNIKVTVQYPHDSLDILILSKGYCEECGQHYLICEAPEWYEASQEKPQPVKEVERREYEEWQPVSMQLNINQLMKGIITATK